VKAAVYLIERVCEPSNEQNIAEDRFRRKAPNEVSGTPEAKVNIDRL